MNKKHCADCYYNTLCGYDEVCDEYYPIDNTAVEPAINDTAEGNRISFRSEWFKYIESFYN